MPSSKSMPKKQCKYKYRLYVTGACLLAIAYLSLFAYVLVR